MSKFIEGFGAPTETTPGFVDSLYIDMNTLAVYKCTKVESVPREVSFVKIGDYTMESTKYTWTACGSGGGGNVVIVDHYETTFDPDTKVAIIRADGLEAFEVGTSYLLHVDAMTSYGTDRHREIAISGDVGSVDDRILFDSSPSINSVTTCRDADENGLIVSVYLNVCLLDNLNNEMKIYFREDADGSYYELVPNNTQYFSYTSAVISIERIVSAIS